LHIFGVISQHAATAYTMPRFVKMVALFGERQSRKFKFHYDCGTMDPNHGMMESL